MRPRLGTPHGPEAARWPAVLRSRPAWLKPVRSSYEQKLERALLDAGFPPLVREHPVVLLDGDEVHPDLGLPDERFFIEIDHPTWHGGLDNADTAPVTSTSSGPATA